MIACFATLTLDDVAFWTQSYAAKDCSAEFVMARPWKELGRYGGVGIDLVLGILILGGVGIWLDRRYWPGHDWGMTGGFLLGVGVGVRNLVRAATRMQKDIERAEAADPEASRWTVDESWIHKDDAGRDRDRDAAP